MKIMLATSAIFLLLPFSDGRRLNVPPVQCQRDGQSYPVGAELPAGGTCSNDGKLRAASRYCQADGTWYTQDHHPVECEVNEQCTEEGGNAECREIQCNRDGQSYPVGTRLDPPPEDNYCRDTNRLATGVYVCEPNGTWGGNDLTHVCAANEHCNEEDGISACRPLPFQCEWDGVEYREGSAVPAPSVCWNGKLVENTRYCQADGTWYAQDHHPVECGTYEQCAEEGGTATCEPIQCEWEGVAYNVHDGVPAPSVCWNEKLVEITRHCQADRTWYYQDHPATTCPPNQSCSTHNGVSACRPTN